MTIEAFRNLALSFPTTTEQPHFEKTSFRINKKIFATLDEKSGNACLKLDEVSQSVYSATAPGFIYPVKNKWGKQGWTIVELANIELTIASEMLQLSLELLERKPRPRSQKD